MHEMSIVQNVLEIVRRSIPAGTEQDVKSIHLRIGVAAGIVTDSLEFCFEALTQNTPLQNSRLAIEHIPITLKCKMCDSTGSRDELMYICPVCGSNNVSVKTGTELEVVDIELRETTGTVV